MRFTSVLVLMAGMCGFSCVRRGFNANDAAVKRDSNSTGITQVDSRPFNAIDLWKNGEGTPILDYPAGYETLSEKKASDGVFFVSKFEYWEGGRYTPATFQAWASISSSVSGEVTNGLGAYRVKGGEVTYKPGSTVPRELKIEISEQSNSEMLHADAVKYCKSKGQRLPTSQELLDLCASGTPRGEKGYGRYTKQRCGVHKIWTATLNAEEPSQAWTFVGDVGGLVSVARDIIPHSVRCVIPTQVSKDFK